MEQKIFHLRQFKSEIIYISREVATNFSNPVMMYNIGEKDRSVMLHLAMKAFYPIKPPFLLLHVDTLRKFREMIELRDKRAKELGVELLVYTNS